MSEDAYAISFDFINYRLKQMDIVWESCPDVPNDPNPVCKKMKEKKPSAKMRYLPEFIIDHSIGYFDFEMVVLESVIDKSKLDWAQIMLLMEWTAKLASECYKYNRYMFIRNIVGWLALFIESHIEPWIEINGGWNSFK